jgi:membrane protease YdiL (CAAX protease family)
MLTTKAKKELAEISTYTFRTFRFYITVFIFTWLFWFGAAFLKRLNPENNTATLLMLLGLLVPSVTAIITILGSKNSALKKDFRDKIFGAFRVNPKIVLFSIIIFAGIIAASILLSTLFGQSLDQFSFAGGFSFSIGGVPTLLTIVLAAFLEELGWRGYAEDSIASYCSWWKESIIFGLVWALWHFPLFLMPGTYQWEILQQSPWFMLNFFVSIMPLGFIITWVYVKNKRSIFACMFFHFTVNFLQEQIAMTQVTKCVETFVLFIAAAIIVLANKDLFFEKRHVGKLLEESTTPP